MRRRTISAAEPDQDQVVPAGCLKVENARVRVVCLALSGKNAAWGWIVEDSNPNTSPLPGTEFVEAAKDGGPGGALDLWNFVAQAPPGSGIAANCGAAVLDAVTSILSGNILVNHAP